MKRSKEPLAVVLHDQAGGPQRGTHRPTSSYCTSPLTSAANPRRRSDTSAAVRLRMSGEPSMCPATSALLSAREAPRGYGPHRVLGDQPRRGRPIFALKGGAGPQKCVSSCSSGWNCTMICAPRRAVGTERRGGGAVPARADAGRGRGVRTAALGGTSIASRGGQTDLTKRSSCTHTNVRQWTLRRSACMLCCTAQQRVTRRCRQPAGR
jgi:hypothetical protein